ncbi:MAG TPA: homocysteine biosynthesis protein [Bacillota bacterium]
MSVKSLEEINERIHKKKAVVVTAEEIIRIVDEKGPAEAAREVDVVTTATFGAMCSSGAFLNFGHADPPIKMGKIWLNDVEAYGGLAAVDTYIGATQPSETRGLEYGGAHVIEDLIAGRPVKLRATSYGTDCYPRTEIETVITKDEINEAYLYNPRNAYQNYAAATNTSDRTLYTYMGVLQPRCGNVTYSTSGELSPLLKDPYYRTIGIGTRIFLGGTQGFVAWPGTQHNPSRPRAENGVPLQNAATLAVIGNLKEMSPRFIRAATFERYGVSMYVGIGIPIPILDEEMVRSVAVKNSEIFTKVYDYSVPSRDRPCLGRVSYAELRRGSITLNGREVPTAPLSSLKVAREIADVLKGWIAGGDFLLTQPVAQLPATANPKGLEVKAGSQAANVAGGGAR